MDGCIRFDMDSVVSDRNKPTIIATDEIFRQKKVDESERIGIDRKRFSCKYNNYI